MAIDLLEPLPDPPLPTDAEEVFDSKAGATLTAQQYMVNVDFNTKLIPAINAATLQITADKGDSAASAIAAAQSATAAANSATAATNNGAAQVALAAAQVGLATTQANLATTNGAAQVALATTQANNAAASAATATAMAQAAGAAVGPTPIPNKFLGTDSAGNVGWRDAGQKIGDALFTARTPDATYLPLNGSVYSQAAYPELFSIVGLISGSFAETWSAVTSNAGSNAINAVETDGNGVWVAAGAAGAMVRSTDNGVTWTAVTSGFDATAISGLTCDRSGIWVAVGNRVITRSTNNGATWTVITNPSTSIITLLGVSTNRAGVFIASTASNSGQFYLVRSVDSGLTWALVMVVNTGSYTSSAIATDRKGTWIANNGVSGTTTQYRSNDDGATWSQFGVPIGFGKLTTDGNGVWIGIGSPTTVTRSADNGVTWQNYVLPTAASNSFIVTDGKGTYLVGSAASTISKSQDGGMTWTAVTPGLSSPLCGAFGKDSVCMIGGAAGVLRRSVPTYTYDTATQFKLPNQPAAIGLAAYIKAKDA